MPTNKIHYSGKQSCNNQGFFPHLSSNIEEVTCQGCINQYYRKNLGGRPPKAEKPAYKVAFSISPSAYEKLQNIPVGDRSSFVSKLIEESNDLAASCEYYVVFIGDRVYGYYASYTLESVKTRAYSDINSSELLRFEKIEKNLNHKNEDIHSCDLDFDDAKTLGEETNEDNSI